MKQKKRENSYSRDRETLDRDETGGYRYLEKNEKVKNVALLNQALFSHRILSNTKACWILEFGINF